MKRKREKEKLIRSKYNNEKQNNARDDKLKLVFVTCIFSSNVHMLLD